MTGKQHAMIGAGLGLIGSYVFLKGNLSPSNLKEVVVPIVTGTVLGSYWPDIDSKKSKASQAFNKIVLGLLIVLVLGHYVNLPIIDEVMFYAKGSLLGNLALFLLVVNTILGKLSSHRQYTHRWLGTLVFIVLFYLAFSSIVSIGFGVGYVAHILADRTTAAGKNLNFFRFQLPLTNSKNEFHVSI